MPIIIWGSRGVKSELDSGTFYCPHCDAKEDYRLKQVRPFFTLFFIPVFPIGGPQRYVECSRCGQTFKETVLDMEPPSEADRLLRQLYQELRTGSSIEIVQEKLVSSGVDRAKAEAIMEQMSEGKTWACPGCGDHFLASVKRCLKCQI